MDAIVNEWAVCAPPVASKRAAHSVILVVMDIIEDRERREESCWLCTRPDNIQHIIGSWLVVPGANYNGVDND
jgi:hypothetical protein